MKKILQNLGRSPSLDWRFAIFCFASILIIFIIIHLYIYKNLSLENSADNTNLNITNEFLNREDIDMLIKKLEEKKLDTTLILDETLNDPSI